MTMETLEFVILPDGRVQEKVTGIAGKSCTEVTAAIEEALGVVVSQSNTAEYFAATSEVTTAVANQNSYSDW
jgi:hypothetical protein